MPTLQRIFTLLSVAGIISSCGRARVVGRATGTSEGRVLGILIMAAVALEISFQAQKLHTWWHTCTHRPPIWSRVFALNWHVIFYTSRCKCSQSNFRVWSLCHNVWVFHLLQCLFSQHLVILPQLFGVPTPTVPGRSDAKWNVKGTSSIVASPAPTPTSPSSPLRATGRQTTPGFAFGAAVFDFIHFCNKSAPAGNSTDIVAVVPSPWSATDRKWSLCFAMLSPLPTTSSWWISSSTAIFRSSEGEWSASRMLHVCCFSRVLHVCFSHVNSFTFSLCIGCAAVQRWEWLRRMHWQTTIPGTSVALMVRHGWSTVFWMFNSDHSNFVRVDCEHPWH